MQTSRSTLRSVLSVLTLFGLGLPKDADATIIIDDPVRPHLVRSGGVPILHAFAHVVAIVPYVDGLPLPPLVVDEQRDFVGGELALAGSFTRIEFVLDGPIQLLTTEGTLWADPGTLVLAEGTPSGSVTVVLPGQGGFLLGGLDVE